MDKIIEKEYIYLPKDLVKKIKDLEDNKLIEQAIDEYFEETKRDLKVNLEEIDDRVLEYRGLMVKAKNEFKKAKEEQIEASYILWEEFDKEMPSIRTKIEALKNEISPITKELKELSIELNKVKTWEIKDLLEIVKEVSKYLDYNNDTGNILKFLFENYKRPEQITQ